MKRVAIVDYGMSNLDSVTRAIEECGGHPVVAAEPGKLSGAQAIILPGVGAFAAGMANLRQRGFVEALNELVLERRVPFLGVCLGMQLMAELGHEGGETTGLGWISGEVRKLAADAPETRIPHVGWNEVYPEAGVPLFRDTPAGKDFYFVHSFHLAAGDPSQIAARTPYCGGFVSAVRRGERILGVQFHPEKSQRAGAALLRTFLEL